LASDTPATWALAHSKAGFAALVFSAVGNANTTRLSVEALADGLVAV
jgi:hypothetical protein